MVWQVNRWTHLVNTYNISYHYKNCFLTTFLLNNIHQKCYSRYVLLNALLDVYFFTSLCLTFDKSGSLAFNCLSVKLPYWILKRELKNPCKWLGTTLKINDLSWTLQKLLTFINLSVQNQVSLRDICVLNKKVYGYSVHRWLSSLAVILVCISRTYEERYLHKKLQVTLIVHSVYWIYWKKV